MSALSGPSGRRCAPLSWTSRTARPVRVRRTPLASVNVAGAPLSIGQLEERRQPGRIDVHLECGGEHTNLRDERGMLA